MDSKEPYWMDDFIGMQEPQRPFVWEYRKQDLKVISKRLGDVRIFLKDLMNEPYHLRDHSWRIAYNTAVAQERRMESAINQIIRTEFQPKLNY